MGSSAKDIKSSQAGSLVFKDKESDLLLAEYNTLRTELLQRFSIRHQLMSLTLTIFGTFLGLTALGPKSIDFVLLYPVLAFFMSNVYLINILKIERITAYMKKIEKYVSERSASGFETIFGWQTFCEEEDEPKKGQPRPFVARFIVPVGTRFIFPVTGTLALAFGIWLSFLETGLDRGVTVFLIIVAVLSCSLTWIILVWETPVFFEKDHPRN